MVSMRIRTDSASGTPSRSKMSSACLKTIRAASGRCVLERRFGDSFEDLAFLVRVADLHGQPESGVIVIKCFGVPARSAMYVGNHAKCDQLLGQVPDLLGNQPRFLVMNKRLRRSMPRSGKWRRCH